MLVPPLINSASTTLMRWPSRMVSPQPHRRVDVRQPNMSTVSRAGMKSSEPWRCSIAKGEQADDDAAVHRVGDPTARSTPWVGMKASPSLVKKGSFVMARGP